MHSTRVACGGKWVRVRHGQADTQPALETQLGSGLYNVPPRSPWVQAGPLAWLQGLLALLLFGPCLEAWPLVWLQGPLGDTLRLHWPGSLA